MDWRSLELKFLNFIAGLCMTFDVDWETDFADDEWCED